MFLFLSTAILFFGLDCGIKKRIDACQKAGSLPASFGRGLFRIDRVENPGMILGLGRKRRRLVKFMPAAVLLAASFVLIPELLKTPSPFFCLGGGLLFGGGAGNLYDHWRRGYVVDYVSLPIPKIRNLYFNLADFGIFAGVLLVWFFMPS